LLVFDEIQSGMGRTGRFFAYQHHGVAPDLLTVAKALAAGYPLGAVLGNERVAESLKSGEHGTTFGGGPLACRLALEVLDVIEEEKMLPRVADLGQVLKSGLAELAARHRAVGEVRGLGLMLGVEMGARAKEVVSRLLTKGYVANAAHETVLRLLPPFIINESQIDEFLAALDGTLGEIEADSR
jgi:acetylornithine/succinyldiaminopimelate/putrescine aminotransferase